jgi:phosphoglycolate phosphatase
MSRPDIVLYDWDNTLVDAWGGVTAALNATFDAFGLPRWTVADTITRVRSSLRDSFPVLFGRSWTRARDIFYATLETQHLRYLAPMPGVERVLAAGAAATQAVVSNKTGRFLRAEVVHLGWTHHFGAVVGAGDATADKPDPAPLRLALARLGAEPGPGVWYVGDTALDMQAARAAGLTAVLLGGAAHDGGIDRAAPDLHFANADALADALGHTSSCSCPGEGP